MDKDTRNCIERATQRGRKLLEDDFSAQLEGTFDVLRTGTMAQKGGGHLSARQGFQREKIVAAIEHKRAAGMTAAEAVTDYVRDAAFTTLNRFVALKMLEARELVQECISKGDQSTGYREFCGMAPGVALLPDAAGYRLYVESLFDELSTEVKVLFDRRDVASALWPRRQSFEALLDVLNTADLSRVWREDETIGWVYQYFNSDDERRAMRDMRAEGASAPRNSRELAVRNQFFTPRYVVEFLTDNTLGRIWYEMRERMTRLVDVCTYMVRPDVFSPRPKKDPRDIGVLDPACGSGHFLLYAFDLFDVIYEEAWNDTASPRSDSTGNTLRQDYPQSSDLQKAVPGLVLRHNLHGVDIDARCAQIAQLALWMRAQRAFGKNAIPRGQSPIIRRSNIVIAEPIPGEQQLQTEFVALLDDAVLADRFQTLVDRMSLAGELGLLLTPELTHSTQPRQGETLKLFVAPAETVSAALTCFGQAAAAAHEPKRKIFSEDAIRGLALVELAQKQFDVVLMNPPFGAAPDRVQAFLDAHYPEAAGNLYAAFLAAAPLASRGRLGALTSSTCLFYSSFEDLRRDVLLGRMPLDVVADLGGGVLTSATVKVAAYCGEACGEVSSEASVWVARCVEASSKDEFLRSACRAATASAEVFRPRIEQMRLLPLSTVAYWLPSSLLRAFTDHPRLEDGAGTAARGCDTGDNERFLRLWWEVRLPEVTKDEWRPYAKGGTFSPYVAPVKLVVNWAGNAHELRAFPKSSFRNESLQGAECVSYPLRAAMPLNTWLLPAGGIFAGMSPAIVPGALNVWELLAWSNSYLVRFLVGLFLGGARTEPGTAANAYHVGILQQLPVPRALASRVSSDLVKGLVDRLRTITLCDETSQDFRTIESPAGVSDVASLTCDSEWWSTTENIVCGALSQIDRAVEDAYGLSEDEQQWLHRNYEPPTISQNLGGSKPWDKVESWTRLVSFAVGVVFGRWNCPKCEIAPSEILEQSRRHPLDMAARVESVLLALANPCTAAWRTQVEEQLRPFLNREFFPKHVRLYSEAGRTAPVFWQLATSSGSYAVWLYLHALTRDTFYKVQNEYVGPALAYEQQKLEQMLVDTGSSPTAAERRELAAQQSLIEDLRIFLDEVKRVAPMWNPNLSDGVIINFAVLWRLVPQHRPWQKELKETWEGVRSGDYDWSHLAMHLWPERVVPKCATDRSLAIAHGLEDVFWAEGDGKWRSRSIPTRSIDDLVRERSSPAVKAALESLLDAPMAAASGGSRAPSGMKGREP